MKQPIQPLYKDESGVVRFQPNEIINWMLEAGRTGKRFDLNTIACQNFSQEDREQLDQLIGYSLCGFGDTGATNYTWEAAEKMYDDQLTEDKARIAVLEGQLEAVRASFRELVPQLFHIHEDDLIL
jgi:hypothetical protein